MPNPALKPDPSGMVLGSHSLAGVIMRLAEQAPQQR